tara:strand:- start:19895 stop:20233 length:339 start_codon:yes stop_codon:yes gene_type:complete
MVQDGRLLTVTAPATIVSGQFVKVGSIFGVAQSDAASGADVVIDTQGVYTLPKNAPLVISAGDPVYWDVADAEFNKTALANWYCGVCAVAALSADTTVAIRLNGTFPAAAGA